MGAVYSVINIARDIERGNLPLTSDASLIDLAIISSLTLVIVISAIVELSIRLFSMTFILIRSFSNMTSVT
jgi:hypothetical protein